MVLSYGEIHKGHHTRAAQGDAEKFVQMRVVNICDNLLWGEYYCIFTPWTPETLCTGIEKIPLIFSLSLCISNSKRSSNKFV